MDRLWTKSFILLTVSMLFLYTGFYALIPILPIHLESIGASSWQIGLVVGMFSLSAVLSRPFVGNWLDRYGRKLYVFLGVIFFALFTLSYSFFSILWIVLILRILHGISWGVGNTALSTAITDQIPASKMGSGMGWYGFSITIAMAFGPLISTYVMTNYSASAGFVFASLITIIPLFFIYRLSYVKKPKNTIITPIVWSKQLMLLLGVIGCLAFSVGGIQTYVPIYLGQQPSDVSLFFLVYAISLAICRPLSGRWIDIRGEKPVITLSLLLIVIALIVLSTVHGTIGVICSAAIYGLGFGMAQPALQTFIIRLLTIGRAGSANALYFSAFDVGVASGSMLLGVFASYWSYSILYLVSSGVVTLGLLLFLITNKVKHVTQEARVEACSLPQKTPSA